MVQVGTHQHSEELMKRLYHTNGTRVFAYKDGVRHVGSVIYRTSDRATDFYRVKWDEPNPDPAYFNLERVFTFGQLKDVLQELTEETERLGLYDDYGTQNHNK